MIVLDESNFEIEVTTLPKVLVYFYQEKGCKYCDMMKPFLEEYDKNPDLGFVIAKYALQVNPDSVVSNFQVTSAPAFFAFVEGKLVGEYRGALNFNQIPLVFTPEKLPFKPVPFIRMSSLQLMAEEANIIDRLVPLREQLGKVKAEIARRNKIALDPIGACCNSCASGGECESCK